jgi:hypothetical protein
VHKSLDNQFERLRETNEKIESFKNASFYYPVVDGELVEKEVIQK